MQTQEMDTTPVIDLFSGPGGLGEGFASFDHGKRFRILVSAEMDRAAHATLRLRAYFRKIRYDAALASAYYDFCHGKAEHPWNEFTWPYWEEASREALQLTLGVPECDLTLDVVLGERIPPATDCVLIGGPPCQAYSLVGRSRNKGKVGYCPEKDHRHYLYREYLRILQKTRPVAFVMENVKGILSSKVGGERIFHSILKDLSNPCMALGMEQGTASEYRIHSLVCPAHFEFGMDPSEIPSSQFIVRSEDYGIPQARHRVILLGVRKDIDRTPDCLVKQKVKATVREAIADLPRLRSGLSKEKDDPKRWLRLMNKHMADTATDGLQRGMDKLADVLLGSISSMTDDLTRGGLRVPMAARSGTGGCIARALADPALAVVLNHETRGHMDSDLKRYAYSAAYTLINDGISPKGPAQFDLPGLRPNHANWKTGSFSDRFRTQAFDRPSTTITSHISKDGHYFIHPDVTQCRSLTVREAARLQTFPDNYFFMGNRTEQFHQVGNAVPPDLARQISAIVSNLLAKAESRN